MDKDLIKFANEDGRDRDDKYSDEVGLWRSRIVTMASV